MKLEKEQYEQLKDCFPKQRKPAKISNLEVLNAVVYVVENGCKRRACPKDEDKTRALAVELGYIPVVPPKSNRKNPWNYDMQCEPNDSPIMKAGNDAFFIHRSLRSLSYLDGGAISSVRFPDPPA